MPDIIASSSAWAGCSREERNTVAALSRLPPNICRGVGDALSAPATQLGIICVGPALSVLLQRIGHGHPSIEATMDSAC